MSILATIKKRINAFVAKMNVYEVAIVFAQANLRSYARTLMQKKLNK